MKITIITLGFPYPIRGILSGIERFSENLAIHLKKLGHEIKVVTTYLNGGKRYDSYKGIPILRILDSKALLGKFGSILILNYYSFSLNLIKKKNFKFYIDSDVIIFTYAPAFSWFFKIKKIPIISVFFHYDNPKLMYEYLTLPFLHHLEKRQFKKIKNIVAISNSSKNNIIKNLGTQANYIKVIPIGVDINRFNSSKMSKDIRERFGNKILLFSGLMVYRKRVPVLLKAMQEVIKHFLDVKLILLGDGLYLNKYMKFAQNLKIDKNLIWKGWVNNTEIYYASSDIFVFPSELEGFGQVITEAMASGTPVICANKAPMSEIVENGGITFKLNNSKDLSKKIVELLSDQEELRKLRGNALKVAKKYEWLHIAETYIDYIKEIKRLNHV